MNSTGSARSGIFRPGRCCSIRARWLQRLNVTEGIVRLYKSLPDGRRQIVGFALPEIFFGLALMDRYGVAAEAVTPVKSAASRGRRPAVCRRQAASTAAAA